VGRARCRPNWSLSKELPAAYKERSIHLLAARAARAFHEMYPMRESITEPGRLYRTLNYGPHLEMFMLDERSYRGANGPNQEAAYGPESFFLGPAQLAWLKRGLMNSRATWTSGVVNTVWLTADVHYAAAHYYNPDKAQFGEFDPFWEFVAGPLHAGTAPTSRCGRQRSIPNPCSCCDRCSRSRPAAAVLQERLQRLGRIGLG
jgi:alkaline phosphatase D